MRVIAQRTNALFDLELSKLAADGIAPSPVECVWLFDLCERVADPDRFVVSAWMPPVVVIDWLTLHPLTIQAMLWLENYAEKWWMDDPHMYVLATAYAMAFGNKAGVFLPMTNRAAASKTLNAFGFRIPCTIERLESAMDRHMREVINLANTNEKKRDDVKVEDYGDMIARVAYWFKKSAAEVMTMTDAQFAHCVRVARAGEGDGESSTDQGLHDREALRCAVTEIRRRHSVEVPHV